LRHRISPLLNEEIKELLKRVDKKSKIKWAEKANLLF